MTQGATQRTVVGDGVELAVIEAGDRARPTVVLIHGWPDTKEMWNPVTALLAARLHVVAYDVRGAGASSAPRGFAAYDLERLTNDAARVIAAVSPEQPVHLVGHDWGALQGWEIATQPRLREQLASFTAIAGPSLDHAAESLQQRLRRPTPRALLELAGRLGRSWYIFVLIAPGGPTLLWRALLGGQRWQRLLEHAERLPPAEDFPGPTLRRDALRGSRLYRRNMPRRLLRPRRDATTDVPVQLIVPSGERFISPAFYEDAERYAPRLRHRTIAGSHWAARSHPELVARWIEEHVEAVTEQPPRAARSRRPWIRGGGVEQLQGALALVTGAGSGIGRATAIALAQSGASLVLVDRDQDGAAETAVRIGGGAHTFACDVSDAPAMENLANEVIDRHGVPDVVINNAGIAVAGSFLDTRLADWRQVIGVNLMGVVHGARLFARAMVERGEGGQIVNTASAAAFTPTKELAAYASSKAAVLMLSQCLRAELGPSGIGVTAVCPGIVATNITSSARYVGHPEADQARVREQVTRMYRRRNFTADQVAREILRAIGSDAPVAVITPEAKLMHGLSRFAPGVLRRLAGVDGLPV